MTCLHFCWHEVIVTVKTEVRVQNYLHNEMKLKQTALKLLTLRPSLVLFPNSISKLFHFVVF